jgi:hypothetical protein
LDIDQFQNISIKVSNGAKFHGLALSAISDKGNEVPTCWPCD